MRDCPEAKRTDLTACFSRGITRPFFTGCIRGTLLRVDSSSSSFHKLDLL